jgi:hypothetical protein
MLSFRLVPQFTVALAVSVLTIWSFHSANRLHFNTFDRTVSSDTFNQPIWNAVQVFSARTATEHVNVTTEDSNTSLSLSSVSAFTGCGDGFVLFQRRVVDLDS